MGLPARLAPPSPPRTQQAFSHRRLSRRHVRGRALDHGLGRP